MRAHLPNPAEARRAERIEVSYRCEITGLSANPVQGLIVDISQLGCMIRCTEAVETGTLIGFVLPIVGAWKGRVVWALGARLGIEFDRPIPEAPFHVVVGQLSRPGTSMDIF